MRSFFIFLFAMFFLQGCANSLPPTTISIKQTSPDSFTFESNKCLTTIPAKFLARNSEAGTLFVDRYFFGTNEGILVLEKISLNQNFIFSVGLNSVVYAGFEFKEYKTKNVGNFHTFFEGKDRNGEDIYVLASGIGVFEDLSVIYSTSKEIIEKLSACVDTGESADFGDIKIAENYSVSKSLKKSDWSAGMLFRHDIISSKRDNDFYMP